jgi:hypothetical protein
MAYRTRDLPACSTVPQLVTLTRDLLITSNDGKYQSISELQIRLLCKHVQDTWLDTFGGFWAPLTLILVARCPAGAGQGPPRPEPTGTSPPCKLVHTCGQATQASSLSAVPFPGRWCLHLRRDEFRCKGNSYKLGL